MESTKSEETWNKKRIFIALSLLGLLIIGTYVVKTRILGAESPFLSESKEVRGVSLKEEEEKEDIKIDIRESVKEKINSLQQEVTGLNVLEIASSSPQIRKIINDIKSLEQYPTNQVREACKKICDF